MGSLEEQCVIFIAEPAFYCYPLFKHFVKIILCVGAFFIFIFILWPGYQMHAVPTGTRRGHQIPRNSVLDRHERSPLGTSESTWVLLTSEFS